MKFRGMKICFSTFIFSFLLSFVLFGQNQVQGELHLKIHPNFKHLCSDSNIEIKAIQNILEHHNARLVKRFPHAQMPGVPRTNEAARGDITTLYKVYLSNDEATDKLIFHLNRLPEVVYAEPVYLDEVTFFPNDALINEQYWLHQIRAFDAWDKTQGSPQVRIAIIDTGTDMEHPDLKDQMAENTNDPINGVDSDNNGYVDDFYGWDFVDNDNNPQATANPHGVHVAGLAAAKVNNGLGIAGVAYNCKFIPVRVGEDRSIRYGYDGIVYAADLGADIINCSWGSYNYSQFGQDIIDYATLVKGALVVGAAGNDNSNRMFYPAAFDGVLSVGALDWQNHRAFFSNYGYWVEIMAPGNEMMSTVLEGKYSKNSGTSMAAPVVSGVAALVKARYPNLSAKQIIERIKATAYDLYNDGSNGDFPYQLGAGRIDANDAVDGIIQSPGVRIENIRIGAPNQTFYIGDTLKISAFYGNYLDGVQNLTAVLSTSSPHVSILNSTYAIGNLSSLAQKNNRNTPFQVLVNPSAPLQDSVLFELTVSNGNYTVKRFFYAVIHSDFIHVGVNRIQTTISSRGNVGYYAKQENMGLGFRFEGSESLLYEAGLMIGKRTVKDTTVVDNIRSTNGRTDEDFATLISARETSGIPISSMDVYGEFSDEFGKGDSMGAKVLQEVYAYADPGHDNYVVVKYNVVNPSPQIWQKMFVGFFADWDIATYMNNKAETDLVRYLAYAYCTDPNTPYVGVQLLRGGIFNTYAFDNMQGGAGGLNITGGYTNRLKYESLESNRFAAGLNTENGNDILHLVSSGPHTLIPNDTLEIAFALMAAPNLQQLQNTADLAYLRYNGFLPSAIAKNTQAKQIKLFPNPSQNFFQLRVDGSPRNDLHVEIIDMQGRTRKVWRNAESQYEISDLAKGIYFVCVTIGEEKETHKLIVQ